MATQGPSNNPGNASKQEACGRSSNRKPKGVRSLLVSKGWGLHSAGGASQLPGPAPPALCPMWAGGVRESVCAECPEVLEADGDRAAVLSLDLARRLRLWPTPLQDTLSRALVLSHPGRTHPELTLAALATQPMPQPFQVCSLESEGSGGWREAAGAASLVPAPF